jgi:hypothetical protein
VTNVVGHVPDKEEWPEGRRDNRVIKDNHFSDCLQAEKERAQA